MKIFNKIFLAILGASLLAVSCTSDESYTKGEPEEEGCFGVYFPAQEVGGAYDPAAEFTFEVTVARTVDKGAITVPVKVEGTGAEFINLDPVAFNDGQSEVIVNGSFSKDIPAGTTFDVSISIDDYMYASKYSNNPAYISFDITVESWKYLGEGSFWDNWIEAGDEFPAKFYQNEGNKNRYRVSGGYTAFWTKWGAAYQKGGWVLCDYQEPIEFEVLEVGDILNAGTSKETKITREDLIYYSPFRIGLHHPSYGADIYRYHPGDFASLSGDDAVFVNNRVDNWQELEGNVIPSVVYLSSYVYMPGVGGWGAFESTDEALTLRFPGGVFVDYSLDVEPGTSVDGKLPISFTTGKDVTAIDYCVYLGELTSKEIRTKKALIAAGEEPEALELDMTTKAVSFSADSTSQYTIIAVAYDKNNNEQNNANAVFGYVKKGDEEKVQVVAGASLENPNAAYQAAGCDTLKYLTFNVYGKDLKKVALKIFTSKAYKDDPEGCWSKISEVSDEVLESINEVGGYTGVAGGLSPLTEYTLLVAVDNGYQTAQYTSVCQTKGLPLVKVNDGTYTTEALFDDEDAAELWFDPNTLDEYKLKYNFGAFTFSLDAATSKIEIEPQVPGYSNKSYGTLYFGEVMEMMKFMYPTNYQTAIAYYENQGMEITSIAGTSAYNETTNTYSFAVCWYLTAGYIGTGVDTYAVDPVTKSLTQKVSSTGIKLVKALEPTGVLTEGTNIIWDAPQFERDIKAASFTVTPIDPSTVDRVGRHLSKPLVVVE